MKKILNILFCAFVLCTGFGGIAHATVITGTGANSETYKNGNGVVVFYFWSSLAGPSKMIKQKIEEIAGQYPTVNFIEVDTTDPETESVWQDAGVQVLPTTIFYHNGEEIDRVIGGDALTLESKVDQYYNMYGGADGVIPKKPFNISYNNGGGSGAAPTAPTTCNIGETCDAPANTYTAPGAGYIFTGWACTHSGTSCGTFLPGQSISNATSTKNSTITLTAQWVDAVSAKTPTSKSYVDSQMNALQPNFAGLGANKLMTYGTTAGAVGSRDIVTTLGTSTTANSVPTRGAINTALNTKQPTMNGTAGYVATNTGTPGVLGEKAVYGGVTKMADALVDAQTLNNAVINAVNSELIQVDAGWRINTVDNLRFLTILPDVSINGTDACYRNFEGDSENGTCGATTLNTLGASGSKSGRWGAVFSYGDIVGKSVCSAITGDWTTHTVATDAQSDVMNAEFSAQSGTGFSAMGENQYNCWCKIESIGGAPVTSSWVYGGTDYCAEHCADDCAYIYANIGWRETVFNSIQ